MAKPITYKGRDYTLESMRELISTKDKACLKALILIQSYQTPTEKSAEQTVHTNGKGWNSTDGEFMGSLAKQYQDTGSLSTNQMIHCKKAIRKYAGQVLNHIKQLIKDQSDE